MKNSEHNNMQEMIENIVRQNVPDDETAHHAAVIICGRIRAALPDLFPDGYGNDIQISNADYHRALGLAVAVANRDEIQDFDGDPRQFIAVVTEAVEQEI